MRWQTVVKSGNQKYIEEMEEIQKINSEKYCQENERNTENTLKEIQRE